MKIHTEEIHVQTGHGVALADITRQVEDIATKSKVRQGTCFVYTPHTTAAIIINEHEDGLMKDIVSKVSSDFPKGGGWHHDKIDNNAHSHLASSYIGPSRSIPLVNGRIRLGTWQSIFLLELDGPRTRSVIIQLMGNSESK